MINIKWVFMTLVVSIPLTYALEPVLGVPTMAYSESQLPLSNEITDATRLLVDVSTSVLKKDATSNYFFISNHAGLRRWTGKPDQMFGVPGQKEDWFKPRATMWSSSFSPNFSKLDLTQGSVFSWLGNIHKISNSVLLGFWHIEDLRDCQNNEYCAKTKYSIGIGRSLDGGNTWQFLNEILRTKTKNGRLSNIGGIAYVVTGQYFYVYFNEFAPLGSEANNRRTGVARGNLKEVVDQTKFGGTIPPFTKRNNGNWNNDGLTGVATEILPPHPDFPILTDYDAHSDACYNQDIGKFMLSVNAAVISKTTPNAITRAILLYTSTDGLNWKDPKIVDQSDTRWLRYSFFSSNSTITGSEDGHIVGGNSVYLIYPGHWNGPAETNFLHNDIFVNRITPSRPSFPVISNNFQ